jgi:hypothetical protein
MSSAPKWTSGIFSIGYKLVQGLNWHWVQTHPPLPAQFAELIAKRNERLARVRPQRTEPIPVELDAVLQEIEKALAAKLYYLAIAVALSVPDICACLEFDPDNPSWANRKTYTDWCNNNIKGMPRLTGDDLYNLRGGALHKGHFGHPKSQFNRVMFIGPESAIKMHGMLLNGEMRLGPNAEVWKGPILGLGVAEFCETIIDSARDWVLAKKDDPFVQRNLPTLVRFRPDGLPPFSKGVPTVG